MDRINQIWPEWHTVELIGRGAFGEVYKAKREKLGEVFYSAVKVIQIPREESEVREMLADGHTSQSIRYYYESIAKGLMNEIKVMEVLKSAGNVVSIEEFDVRDREDGIGWEAFIRMELLRNLNDYRQGREMSQEEAVKLGSDICEALICCEKSRIIHRDIKPSNIFVDVYGNFKLGDFGIARQLEKTQSTLSQKGTEMYMAPEVRYGESGSSYNVDVYSLGLVMYRLLNGNRMPFEPADKEMISFQEREEALARRLRGEKLPLPAKADPALGRIIVKACEADKAKRYQSAEEMKADLLLFSSGQGTERKTTEKAKAEEQGEPARSRVKAETQFEEEETVSAFSEFGQARGEETYTASFGEKADAGQEKHPINGEDVYVTREVRQGQEYVYVKPIGAQVQRRIELPKNASAAQSAPVTQNRADSVNREKPQKGSTTTYKAATAAMVVGAVILVLYSRQKNFSPGEAMAPWVVIFLIVQVIGLLLVCLKNSKVGAVLCMPSGLMIGVIPMILFPGIFDHTLLTIVMIFVTLALWIFLFTVPWMAVDAGKKKK